MSYQKFSRKRYLYYNNGDFLIFAKSFSNLLKQTYLLTKKFMYKLRTQFYFFFVAFAWTLPLKEERVFYFC